MCVYKNQDLNMPNTMLLVGKGYGQPKKIQLVMR